MHPLLIDATTCQQLLASGQPVRVFDCSFELMNPPEGRRQYLQDGHLPNATYASVDDDLAAHGGRMADGTAASAGRHPLPTREAFAQWLGQQGVTPQTQVVVYDRQGSMYAGRLWWMLKWCGHEAVALLDGGLQAWQAAGGPLTTEPPPTPLPQAPYPLATPRVRAVGTAELAAAQNQPTPNGPVVLDARGAPRYRGEVEPLDPVAGHIPGALNRPFTDNTGPDGRLKPSALLREEFLGVLNGVPPERVVHQCGSGVSAVLNLIAMEHAGLGRQALYPGSWSEWSRTPGLPVATGG